MRKLILTMMFLMMYQSSFSQKDTISNYVKHVLLANKNTKTSIAILSNEEIYKRINSSDTAYFNVLKSFETDSNYFVRDYVYRSYWYILVNKISSDRFNFQFRKIEPTSADSLFKKMLHKKLLSICADSTTRYPDGRFSNQGICYSIFLQYHDYIDYSMFDAVDRKFLINVINQKKEIEIPLILIAGWLDLTEVMPHLKYLVKIPRDKFLKNTYEYNLALALARLGDKQYIDLSIQNIKKAKELENPKQNSSYHLGEFLRSRDLQYIKQHEVIDLFEDLLKSKTILKSYNLNPPYDTDASCIASWFLMYHIKSFKDFILKDHYDKKRYEEDMKEYEEYTKYGANIPKPQKTGVECSEKTYKAAQRWFEENKGKYIVEFDRSKFYDF